MAKKMEAGQTQTLKKVLRYMKPYRFFLLLSVILAAITVASTLYLPLLIGKAVDCIVGKGNVNFDGLIAVLIKMAVMIGITALAQWIMNVCNNKLTYQIVRDIRNEAFEKIEVLPLKYIDGHAHGEIVSRVIADVDQFADGLLMGFTQLFTGVITILGTIGFMLSVNVGITIVVLVVTPVSLFVASFIAKRTFSMFKAQSETRGEQTALIDEMIGNQKLVKGAHLPLARHGQARDHQAQHKAEHADEIGQKKPLKFQVGVEPAAHPHVQAGRAGRRRGRGPTQRRVPSHALDDPVEVIGRDLGRVGAPPVQNHLCLGGFASVHPAGKFLVKHQDEERPLPFQYGPDALLRREKTHAAEGGRALQAVDDLAAPTPVVVIQHGHVHIAHLHGGGPAENHDLHQRRHDDQDARNAVAEQDQQFLAHDGDHAPPVQPGKLEKSHIQTSRRLTRFLYTRPSSTAASRPMNSRLGPKMLQTSPVRKMVRRQVLK